ncbi:MAG: hypothetical protein K0Q95_726 [Bacteroidota bacterium]|jgi:hypothetical protein|nr:hypothetical protein [Bacteroidota bacterium]
MGNFKEKAQVFIIGLSIGLLIAGAFFILKLDDYFKELNLYKKMSQTFVQVPSPAKEKEVNSEKEKPVEVKISKKTEVNNDSTTKSPLEENVPDSPDTTLSKADSSVVNAEEIVVRKDELLSTRTLEVNNLNPTANKQNGKDSLLQKVSGIKDDKFTGKQMFNIELWQSPLNYKGYKLGKYKMVLYGINTFEGLKLYKLDDVIYMKIASAVYRLDYASDFKQYERITDEQIINKLK